jgi:single-stranded-DNA-specific exonuclease
MKIKQIGPYNGDIISTILRNRGIEDIDSFLNPSDKDDLDPFELHNMETGVNLLISHLSSNNNISILVDSDADGFSSASIIYQYIKKVKPESKLSYFLHDRKAHGLTEEIIDQISTSNTSLLIIPDAASNDTEAIDKLFSIGIEIIILDHHEVDRIPNHGVLINNQLELNKKTNKNLVGAGLVLKFCQALDKTLGLNYSQDLYDLAAIGQIGDTSDISENEVRNIVFKGLNNIKNPLLKLVLKDRFGSLNNIVAKDLSFSIIPMINSIVRIGEIEERDLLFRALNGINADETFIVEKRKKNKETGKFEKHKVNQNLYEYVYDIMKKVKNRQNTMIKKAIKKLSIYKDGGILVGILDMNEEAPLTGVIATKIMKEYQKPALILHYDDGKYIGSGRGDEKTFSSFKDWCNETGLVEFARGHANAFGISIPEENFEKFLKRTYEIEKKEIEYKVDLIIKDKADKKPIIEINNNKHLFGGKVHDPLLAYVGIQINKNYIKYHGSTLVFRKNGIEFVMYGAPESLYESLVYNFDQYITMDFVGIPSENTFGGRNTPQLVLVACEKNEGNQNNYEEVPDEVTVETIVF